MTIFSRLFGKRPAFIQTEAPATIDAAHPIAKELFIEDRAPHEFEVAQQLPAKQKTILHDLLQKDYHTMGHRDGHRLHDLTRQDLQLEIIAAEFRQAYDMALQDIEIQLEQICMHLTEKVAAEAPDIHEKLQTRHDQLVKQKRELMLQKDLAVTGEGFVEKSVRYYKAGFREGFDLYVEGELIFKHIKTL